MDDQGQVHHDKCKEEEAFSKITSLNEEDINAIESAKEAAAKIKKILTQKVEDCDTSSKKLIRENISETTSFVGLGKEHTLEETLGLSEEKEQKKVVL